MTKSNPNSKIPVRLLSGFLGSGKTTLVRSLLEKAKNNGGNIPRTAVIVNEFGAVGLDHMLIGTARDDIIDLSGGCICCSVRAPMIEAIERVLEREPEMILIETSGLARPEPIVSAIMEASGGNMPIRFAGLCTLVDSIEGMEQVARHAEAREQIVFADRIGLTKLDRVDPSQREALKERLSALIANLNPTARIEPVETLGPSLLNEDEDELHQSFASHPLMKTGAMPQATAGLSKVSGHATRIKCVMLERNESFVRDDLLRFLDLMITRYGKAIVRLKGIIRLQGFSQPQILQGVGSRIAPLETGPDLPDDTPSRLFIFAEAVSVDEIERLFASYFGAPVADTPDRAALVDNPLAIPGYSR